MEVIKQKIETAKKVLKKKYIKTQNIIFTYIVIIYGIDKWEGKYTANRNENISVNARWKDYSALKKRVKKIKILG